MNSDELKEFLSETISRIVSDIRNAIAHRKGDVEAMFESLGEAVVQQYRVRCGIDMNQPWTATERLLVHSSRMLIL